MRRVIRAYLQASAMVAVLGVGASMASAGCWTCEEEVWPEGTVWVCVGVDISESGWTTCDPGASWNDDIWCKLAGGPSPCSGGGGGGGWCPQCRRYPAIHWRPDASVLTTQTLIFEGPSGDELPSVSHLQISDRAGFDPTAAAGLFGARSGAAEAPLVGYSVKSSRIRTNIEYRSARGDRLIIDVARLGDGYVASLVAKEAGTAVPTRTNVLIAAGEAAVLRAQVDGKSYAIVLRPVTSTGAESTRVGGAKGLHEPFLERAEQFRSHDLSWLVVTTQPDDPAGQAARTMSSLRGALLMSSLIVAYR